MHSKLPNSGTSIFAVMTKMANEHQAINLAQGFPDFEVSEKLIDLIHYYMQRGDNQYAPMPGVPALRAAIVGKIERTHQVSIDANTEITVTAGATQALYTVISALVNKGDEVIYFDPAYDSYVPAIILNSGVPVPINLNVGDFSIPWHEVAQKINARTKLIIINSPQNPTGAILSTDDLKKLEELISGKDIYVLSDEVYEHIIFDGQRHASVLDLPAMRKQSIAVFSFGKTFHATGWKMGYAIAPENITREIQKIHQFMVFSVNTPIQYALAGFMQHAENYEYLPGFYQQKRDAFLQFMAPSRFEPLPCTGTYFQTFSYRKICEKPEREMAAWLTENHGVASIPLSPFYTDDSDHFYLRFCFAKNEQTLKEAATKLCQI